MTRKEFRAWCKTHGGTIDRSGSGVHDVLIGDNHLMLHYDPDRDPVVWVRIEVPKSRYQVSLVGQLRQPTAENLETFIEQLLTVQDKWPDPEAEQERTLAAEQNDNGDEYQMITQK